MPRDQKPPDESQEDFANRIREAYRHPATLIPDEQLDVIAERAADRAIEKMWRNFGIDITDAEGVRALNEDFIHLRKGRLFKAKLVGAIVLASATGILATIGNYVLEIFKGHFDK